MARSRSRSPSRSRSRSGSLRRNQRSRSASRDDDRRSRSRSYSRSPVRRNHRRSRSRSPRRGHYSRYGGGGRRGGAWSGNRSRDNPDPSRCVGIFNLSLYTNENDLRETFGKFGDIEKVELVYDHPTGRSRGFGFVYFDAVGDATTAREEMNGSELDGHKIRVDFSITRRAHTPTPGQYMGGGGGRGGGGRRGDYRGRRDTYARDSYRRRSPSPRHRRSPSPRYDRDRRSRSGSY